MEEKRFSNQGRSTYLEGEEKKQMTKKTQHNTTDRKPARYKMGTVGQRAIRGLSQRLVWLMKFTPPLPCHSRNDSYTCKTGSPGPWQPFRLPFFILVNGNWLKAQLRREASSGSKKYWANSMLDMLTVRKEKFQMGFLFKNSKKKKNLTSGSDFASGFAWATGVVALAFTSGRPCEFPTPATVLVADTVLVMGLTWAAGVEVRLLLLTSRACDGAIGNSRKLLFLGAVGCSCWFGRLTIFCEGVFWKAEKKMPILLLQDRLKWSLF